MPVDDFACMHVSYLCLYVHMCIDLSLPLYLHPNLPLPVKEILQVTAALGTWGPLCFSERPLGLQGFMSKGLNEIVSQ